MNDFKLFPAINTIRTSVAINELAAALSKAQSTMQGAKKDSLNPHFRSKYPDLASVWDACREALTANGLSVVQSPRMLDTGNGLNVEVETLLLHTSGQWLADSLAVPVSKADAQGVGSAITYARRYALAAVVGVAPEDDDAESAVGRDGKNNQFKPAPPERLDSDTGEIVDAGAPLTITNVTMKQVGNGATQYSVTFSDGLTATTINKTVGANAMIAWNGPDVVEREVENKGRFCNLTKLTRVNAPPLLKPERVETPPESEIPF